MNIQTRLIIHFSASQILRLKHLHISYNQLLKINTKKIICTSEYKPYGMLSTLITNVINDDDHHPMHYNHLKIFIHIKFLYVITHDIVYEYFIEISVRACGFRNTITYTTRTLIYLYHHQTIIIQWIWFTRVICLRIE